MRGREEIVTIKRETFFLLRPPDEEVGACVRPCAFENCKGEILENVVIVKENQNKCRFSKGNNRCSVDVMSNLLT